MSGSSARRAKGTGALVHLVGAGCAAAVPLLMLLPYLGNDEESENAWALERIDIVTLIFCVLAALMLAASFTAQRRPLSIAAAGLLFAAFGLVLAFPLEFPGLTEASVKIGGYLTPLAALLGAGAAIYAAELVPSGAGAPPPPAGAGGGLDPSFTTPIGGGAPAPTGQPQSPAGGGAAPGWYDDPHKQARLRYFDGQNWTEQTSN